jgi:Mg-chelatase subunit ChlD
MQNTEKYLNYQRKTSAFNIFLIISMLMLPIIVPAIQKVIKYIANNHNTYNYNTIQLLASTEYKDLEELILNFTNEEDIDINITYASNIEIVDRLNANETFDAVWASNSLWLYMLKNPSMIKNSKSILINPVVFGIKKSKAIELGLIDKKVTNKEILDLIKTGKLKYVMTSVTQTNTGATAFLNALNVFAGNKEILTKEDLQNEELKASMVSFFKGVERVSGSEEFLGEMFLMSDYNAVVTYESSLIELNQKLTSQNKEPLYLIYPSDGVAINDSPLAFIDNGSYDQNKKDNFQKIQSYLLDKNTQEKLMQKGRRVWYGGINDKAPKNIFNKEWGIDTNKYLIPTKYPSIDVVRYALNLYQEEFRKPVHVVFGLDYSGSMSGDGHEELTKAMEYILTYETASVDLIQFSKKDKITVLPFNDTVFAEWTTYGDNTESLIERIKWTSPSGGTNIYDTAIKGINVLEKVNSDEYGRVIIIMTDGEGNLSSFSKLQNHYKENIPIYSITFGNSVEYQLAEIASLTNAKVFDGKSNLTKAFKEVRGYN